MDRRIARVAGLGIEKAGLGAKSAVHATGKECRDLGVNLVA